MDDTKVEIFGCLKCDSLTMIESDKELMFCGVCGEQWGSNNLYVGGSGFLTGIVENG